MKKTILLGSVASLLLGTTINAQVTTAGNNSIIPPQFVGFNGVGPVKDLDIRNNFNRPINFWTNNVQRLVMYNGGTANNAGQIAMGNNLPNNFVPQSRLHLYQTGGFNSMRFTTDGTGHGANDGYQMGIGPNGDVAFINNEIDQNFSWYNQGSGPGNLLARMRLFDGGVGETTGRLLIGNDLSTNYVPQARLHMVQFGAGTNNSMLRTDGKVSNLNTWSMWLGTNENTVQEQFRISNQVTGNAQNSFRVGTIVNKSLKFTTEDSTRVIILGRTNIFYERDGFTGFNNLNPLFHIDVRTQDPSPNPNSIQRGELIFRGRIVNDPNAYISFINIAGGDSLFMPTLFGNQSNKTAGGLNTLGSIVDAQDFDPSLQPVTRFISGKDYNPVAPLVNPDLTLDRNNVVVNRRIFGWNNSHDELMSMQANGFLGIGTITPGNRVEINSDYYEDSTMNPAGTWTGVFQNFNPTTPNGDTTAAGLPATGFSGLRFSDLTAVSVPQLNPGIGVLAIDSLGDVIYVPAATLGGICNAAPNQLNDWEIKLDNHTFIFSGQEINDRVGIGTGCLPTAKFQVLDNTGIVGPINTSINTNHSNGQSVALYVTNNSSAVGSIGGFFQASSANKTHAIVVPNNGGNVGFGTTAPNPSYRLEVIGQSNFIGNVFSSGILQFSDQLFKTNVSSFSNAMNIINQLNPTSYYLDTLNNFGMQFSAQKQYGFIAQEVEQILPELITESSKAATYDSAGTQLTQGVNYKSLNYQAIIPILTQGIKEQQNVIHTQDSIINDLNTRLTTLENCLSGILPFLCQLSNSSIQQNDEQTQQNIIKELKVQLDNSQSIVLGQNVPNPFAEQTVIEYFIPEAVKQAQIIFYNQTGQIINTVNIEEMGNGRLTVFANDLSSGIYTYTLVADGQVIATKKMVKTK